MKDKIKDLIKTGSIRISTTLLPLPRITILVNSDQFNRIIQAFQDLRYIGELRQRWEEIKKLQLNPSIAVS